MSDTSYSYSNQGGYGSPSDCSTPGEQGSSSYTSTPHSQNTSPSYQPDKYQHPCPYEDCDRVFACPHNVAQHCREKHGHDGRSDCDICGASFARNWPLYRHTETVHGINIHPGRGQKRRRSRGRKTIGRRGPKLVHPQPTRVGRLRIHSDTPVFSDTDADVGAVQNFDTPEFLGGFDAGFFDETTFQTTTQTTFQTTIETPLDDEITDANFTYQQITCALCLETFEIREDFLGHLHIAHSIAYSDLCDCMVCTAQKLSGIPFEEVQIAQTAPETTKARAGAPETGRQSLLVETTMEVDESSMVQDSPVSPLSIEQLPEGEVATTAGSEQAEDESISNWFDFDDASAGYDLFDLQHLDAGYSKWLQEAELVFEGLGVGMAEDDAVMQQY